MGLTCVDGVPGDEGELGEAYYLPDTASALFR